MVRVFLIPLWLSKRIAFPSPLLLLPLHALRMDPTSKPVETSASSTPSLPAMLHRERQAIDPLCSTRPEWDFYPSQNVRHHNPIELLYIADPPDHPDDDGGSSGTTGSPDVSTDEQLSEYESFDGLGKPISAGPSTPDQIFTTPPLTVLHALHPHVPENESQFSPPAQALSPAPIPSYQLPNTGLVEDPDLLRGEEAYRFLSDQGQAINCSNLYPQMTGSFTVPPVIDQPGIPLYATTFNTGYDWTGLPTHWNTPVATQSLLVESDNCQFMFNGLESATPTYPVWDTSPTLGDFSHKTTAPDPLVPPPTYPPRPATPMVTGKSDDSEEIRWKNIARILEGDRPQVTASSPASDQNAQLTPLQQALTMLESNSCGENLKTLQQRLVKVEYVVLSLSPE